MVAKTKASREHDLCLIQVNGDLHANTTVASSNPVEFYERATIAGHPNLLPTVVTSGHFSGKQIIQVLTGFRACTAEDMADPTLGFICLITRGKLPEVRSYEAVLVTATIMAGSSGSAVYNEGGELAGLAFAGSGALSYAYIVPFAAVKRFLDTEQFSLDFKSVNNVLDIASLLKNKSVDVENATLEALEQACRNNDKKNSLLNTICRDYDSDMIWRE